MKKRILMLLIVCMVVMSFSGCGADTKITKSGDSVKEIPISSDNFILYETLERDEYLSFLNDFDDSKYGVLDVSIGYYGRGLKDYINHYAVTYADLKTIESINIAKYSEISSDEIYIYETLERDEYLSFLEKFIDSDYVLIDISIGYYGNSLKDYINHYAVTYKMAEEKWYDDIVK